MGASLPPVGGVTGAMRHSYVNTALGQIHVTEVGAGPAVLLLHQTPRSWTEYRRVLPLLGRSRRAIALDTLGFGNSTRPTAEYSIEIFADAVDAVAEALGLDSFDLVGHHTGGVVAIEVAARDNSPVRRLVLSGTAYSDEQRARRMAEHGPIDLVEASADGSHLVELWNRRRHFYSDDDIESLNAFVVDALRGLTRVEDGHRAVHAFRAAPRLARIRADALVICGADDVYGMPDVPKLAAALGCASSIIPDAGVALPEERPTEFSEVIESFLAAPA